MQSKKTRQADRKQGFVTIYPLGLFRYNGCGFAAVGGVCISFLQNAKAHYPCQAL
ncbi:MAG: hypothetical protein KKH97_02735 [Proteobacteria bacterium]|nr:hypothetical protein [Pseudomonadota bacterium]MBU1712946.1 hypothetical protein [Pseudomonadota bacterium]